MPPTKHGTRQQVTLSPFTQLWDPGPRWPGLPGGSACSRATGRCSSAGATLARMGPGARGLAEASLCPLGIRGEDMSGVVGICQVLKTAQFEVDRSWNFNEISENFP